MSHHAGVWLDNKGQPAFALLNQERDVVMVDKQ